MWHFKAVSGYDYATAMARLGHVSLVLDRLGYLPSGQPGGTQTCFGAEADQFDRVETAGQIGCHPDDDRRLALGARDGGDDARADAALRALGAWRTVTRDA